MLHDDMLIAPPIPSRLWVPPGAAPAGAGPGAGGRYFAALRPLFEAAEIAARLDSVARAACS